MSGVDTIFRLLAERGDSQYGGEQVTQLEHALQAATLAMNENASPALIVAALLHDIGHLLHNLPDRAPDEGIDDCHETSAGNFLRKIFPESVTEPVRLHVAAKRYLCAVDPKYLQLLSQPSITSLQLQGGPMSMDEVNQFRSHAYSSDALRLRRWDDEAKDPDFVTPPLDHFRTHAEQVCKKEN